MNAHPSSGLGHKSIYNAVRDHIWCVFCDIIRQNESRKITEEKKIIYMREQQRPTMKYGEFGHSTVLCGGFTSNQTFFWKK